MYKAITRNIEVEVEPFYMEDRSDPAQNRYVWGYRITIDNQSDDSVQLMSRRWQITDGVGRVEEVHGSGVVGEQPKLDPGDSYQYTSGEMFEVAIPAFSLDLPGTMRTVN